MLEKLESLPINEFFVDNIKGIVTSKDVSELRILSKGLLLYAEKNLIHEKDKKEPSESLAGTYEETYSNWRNKVEEAAEQNNVFASFMNMCNLQYFFTEISSEYSIGTYNIMGEYNPDCLEDNVRLFKGSKIYVKYTRNFKFVKSTYFKKEPSRMRKLLFY